MRSLGRIYEAVEVERKLLEPPPEPSSPEAWVRSIAAQAGRGAASISDPALFEEEMLRLAALAIAAVDAQQRKDGS